MSDLIERDISTEEYREYELPDRVYRIDSPKKLFTRDGGTTHRVVDFNNVVHCVPFPVVGNSTVVLRWKNFDSNKPVNF